MSFGLRTAYRLVIAGCSLEAVTDPAMERASSDGRQRVQGLRRDGLRIEEEAILAEAVIEASGVTFSIVDRQRDNAWTEALTRVPRVVTTLQETIGVTGTATFDVLSVDGFAVGDFVHIGTECLEVTSTVASPPRLTCARARRDTQLQRHVISNFGADLVFPEVLSTWPRSLEGRRVFLYRYVKGTDDFQGEGRLFWRGVITSDAELAADGSTWSIQADNVTALWNNDLGESLEETFTLDGIFYPDTHPFRMTISESEVVIDDFTSIPSQTIGTVEVSGFFDGQGAFLSALNTAIRTMVDASPITPSWASLPVAVFDFDHWAIRYTAGSTPRWVLVRVQDGGEVLDGRFRTERRGDPTPTAGRTYTIEAGYDAEGNRTLATVPRAIFNPADPSSGTPSSSGVIYYSGSSRVAIDPAVEPLIQATWPSIVDTGLGEELVLRARVGNSSTSVPRYFEAQSSVFTAGPLAVWVGDNLPTFRISLRLMSGPVGQADLGALRDRLVELGPLEANAGNAPFIVPTDLTSWGDVVDEAAAGRPFLNQRFLIQSQAAEVAEILSAEAQLLGCFFRLNRTGQVELQRLRPPTQQAVPTVSLGPSSILPKQPARWQRAPFGFFTEGRLLTGYNHRENEHQGTTFVVRSRNAIAYRKLPKELVIEPISTASVPIDDSDAPLVAGIFQPLFSTLGQSYAVLEVTIPSVEPGVASPTDYLATCLVGEIISITSHRLPNPQGGRGVTDARALIISRDWDLKSEQGTLRCIISEAPVAGYTPSVRVTSVVSGDGTATQTLAVDFMDPVLGTIPLAPDGSRLSDFFAVDDRVEHLSADATSQTPRPGTVTAVDDDAGTLSVTLDAAASLVLGYLRYASADDAALTDLQRGFSFWGDAAGVVAVDENGDGFNDVAKRYA